MLVFTAGLFPSGGSTPAAADTLGPVNIARQAGLYQYIRTYSANVADYNNDGYDDVFIPEHDPQAPGRGDQIPPAHLFQGGPGGFTDVGFPGRTDRHGCTWGDVNRDGLPDMFCAVGLTSASVNELWIQNPDHSFTNKAALYGLTQNSHGRYRTATFVDVNGDGWPDIYVTRYYGANPDPLNPSPAETNPYPSELWINQGGTHFTSDTSYGISVPLNAEKDNHGCNQAVDFNGDGRQDLLVCATDKLRLYRNDGGSFTNVAGTLGIGGRWNDAEFADLNGDGLLDLVEVQNSQVRVLFQHPDGSFNQVFSAPMTYGLNVAVGDINGDNVPDIYVVGSCSIDISPDNPDLLILNTSTQTSPSFSAQALPAITPKGGCGDDVATIRYAGQTDFLVLNGRRHEPGPTQLWAWGTVTSAADTLPPDLTAEANVVPYDDLEFGTTVGSGGGIPVDAWWFGTDDSGIQSYSLQRTSDGGASWINVGLSSPTAIQKTLQLPPGGPYQLRISATDKAGNTSSYFYGPSFTLASRDETDAAFSYSGSWTDQTESGAMGGTVMSSSTAGDAASFAVPTGTRWVALVVHKGPDEGKATIYVNNQKLSTVDLYAKTDKPRWLVWDRGIGSGTPTVKVIVSGTHSASSTGDRVDVDGAALMFGNW